MAKRSSQDEAAAGLLVRLATGALTPEDQRAVDAMIDRLMTGQTLTPTESLFTAKLLTGYEAGRRKIAAGPNILGDYLTRDQLAEQLKCHKNTLSRKESDGTGPVCFVEGGIAYYHREDVEAWLQAKRDYKRKARDRRTAEDSEHEDKPRPPRRKRAA